MVFSLLAFLFFIPVTPEFVTIRGEAQGTTYMIRFVSGEGRVDKMQIDSIFKEIDRSLSLYDPLSLINEFNRAGRVLMDQHMKTVVETSVNVHRESGGAFDITTAALSKTWGFGPGDKGRVPSKRKIRKALAITGTDKIAIRGDSLIALKKGLQIDCNGIAQGYSVDVIIRFLSSRGIEQMLVEVGGEVSVKGNHPETGDWKIGIESVEPVAGAWRPVDSILMLRNKAVTTSGDYRRYFNSGNNYYSHVIDPSKGRPVNNGVIAVTVIAGDAITADAWDNAFFVMGVDGVTKYMQRRKDLSVIIIYHDKQGLIHKYVKAGE